ncbi:hypothetical protein ACQ7HM_20520 [Williamsia sp. MIQD14]|uniref:hypothetical protein n=1 Tax=Williamsia sp. MIQD14 TaxID=3425703 RepID=UPI003DA05703
MDRYDLYAFVSRAHRLDPTSAIRLRRRGDGGVGVWVHTPFDVLATRVVRVAIDAPDIVHDSAVLHGALRVPSDDDATAREIDAGFSVDSAWQSGALPPESGFVHVDDVPARAIVELSREGADVARTQGGPQGPPASLLDQTVLEVSPDSSSEWTGTAVAVTMRAVFAITAMGFVTDADGRMVTETSSISAIDPGEPVRVRTNGAWARIDARFGSVYFRRTVPIALTAT